MTPHEPGYQKARDGNKERVIGNLKNNWQEFKESEPGHRFKDRYHRRRQDEQGHIIKRVFLITLGAIIAVGSLALAPLPGPGWGPSS